VVAQGEINIIELIKIKKYDQELFQNSVEEFEEE
jgi:hypothetical protein